MYKWINSSIKYVIGYNINKKYIDETKIRYSKINKKDTNIKIIYKNIDLREQFIYNEYGKVNIITCNFVIHYKQFK